MSAPRPLCSWTGVYCSLARRRTAEIASSELFDPRTNSFSRTAGVMAEPRIGHSVTTLRDGRVLVAGGRRPLGTGAGPLDTASCSIRRRGRSARRAEWSSGLRLTSPPCSPTGGSSRSADLSRTVTSRRSSTPRRAPGRWPARCSTLVSRSRPRCCRTGACSSPAAWISTSTTELFDPSTGQFERAHRWPTPATAMRPSALPTAVCSSSVVRMATRPWRAWRCTTRRPVGSRPPARS